MVDCFAKEPTIRQAVAAGEVRCARTPLRRLGGNATKGDVLGTAQTSWDYGS
jgi:molybdenum cofactor biosynthesis enzyme